MSAIELIVGLGNPGLQYAGTRHNCGFMVLDQLSQRWRIPFQLEKRFQGYYGEGRALQAKQRLLKPDTFMNLSGQSVRSVIDWYKLPPESVLVIYDDIDLPLGRIRLRASGSAGGHNGIKSLIAHLGTDAFPRLRLGVGQPQGKKDLIGHVLGGFTPDEKPCLEAVLSATLAAIELCLTQDLQTAMNRYNALSLCPSTES